jgi:Tfp pilus assembly protein PilF
MIAFASVCAAAAAAAEKLSPILPLSPPGLIYVEGEDAVSTNMATEPTLNYGCSGNRALQLARGGQLPGGAAFYAEYTVYVDRAGTYELWYGGTPPGPKDEFTPSLASPLSIVIDGAQARQLFREDVNVVERYAPAYYWVRTPAIDLAQGAHVIRFEVSAKRRLDERFFFYLDAFFLASPDALAAAKMDRRGFPALFPKNPDDRSIDYPFESVEDYQSQIQAQPTAIVAYVELSDEYSLMGDYLGALKTLSKASILEPRNPEIRLLAAKNRIWRGDVKEGIEAYGIYTSLRPDDLAAYEEAGKVAAWSGRYSDSEYFYKTGLAAFPGSASLTVNMGLSMLWAGRVADAERDFAEAEKSALTDEGRASDLASIYRENGFPDRALGFYEKAIAAFPAYLGLYLDEGALLAEMGKDQAEEALEARIAASFAPSPELDATLAAAKARRQLKAHRIAELEGSIAADPEDLGLRDDLTRVYAWNGRKAEAARQLESILAARFAKAISDSDEAIAEVYSAQFSAAALRADADSRLSALAGLRVAAQAADGAADKAMAALQAAEKRAAAGKGPSAAGDATEGARKAASGALETLATAIASLEAEDARVLLLSQRADALKDAMDEAWARDDSDEQTFKALTKGLAWTYDAAYAAEELAAPSSRGEQIASLARARVLVPARDGKEAQASLAAVSSDSLAAGRLHAELMLEARRDYKALYKKALGSDQAATALSPGLAAAVRELGTVAAALPAADRPAAAIEAPVDETDAAALSAYAGALREALAAALGADSEAAKAAALARGKLVVIGQEASDLEDRRLARAWYAFESSSLDLRSELGACYEALGQAAAATRQYQRVLDLDPSNLVAMFSLAQAEEKSGDWAAAAHLFKMVNAADPYYLNAATRYNGIAKEHAPGFESSTSFLADSNLFDYRSQANVVVPLGSFLSMKPFSDLRSIRDRYAGSPEFIGATVGLEAPISFALGSSGDGLVLRPSGSLIATSADFAAPDATTVSPSQFVDALSMYSAGGLALDTAFGAWRGSASYAYAPLPDSLNPANEVLFAHRIELSEGAYLPLGGVFRYLAPRLYASGGYVPEDLGNLYGTALAELIPAFRLSDSPWANLGIPLDLVFEDSRYSRTTPYYAADQALTAKGGLLWQSTYSLNGGDSLSISLEGMGGLYMLQSLSPSPARYPYMYAFGRLDWIRPDATYSLTLEASATDPFNPVAPEYWSFSIMGGISSKQPSLIAP